MLVIRDIKILDPMQITLGTNAVKETYCTPINDERVATARQGLTNSQSLGLDNYL